MADDEVTGKMSHRRVRRRLIVAASGVVIASSAAVLVGLSSQQPDAFAAGYDLCGARHPSQPPTRSGASLYYVSGSSFLAPTFSATAVERSSISPSQVNAPVTGIDFRPPGVAFSAAPAGGSGVQALWSPSVNRAGTEIAYVTGPADMIGRFGGEGDIAVSDVTGRHRRVLAHGGDGSDPTWSPDGKEIAFVQDGTIFLMRPDGGGVHAVASPSGVNTVTWSPSGACIAAAIGQSPSRIAIIDVRANSYKWLRSSNAGQYYPAWSPSGNSLVYAQTDPSGLYIADLSHRHTRLLAACPESNCTQDLWPAWSPDGSLIAFARNNGGYVQICIVAAAGGAVEQVTRGPEQHSLPTW
jgi:Tol biopolymer transport system component